MRYTIEDIQRYTRRFYGQNSILVTPFGYPIFFASVSVPQTIQIQANADFLMFSARFRSAAPTSIANKAAATLALQIRESGSKEPFTDSPVCLENYAGNSIGSRELDYPRFLAGGSTVELTLTNPFSDQNDYSDGLEIYLSGTMVRVFNA